MRGAKTIFVPIKPVTTTPQYLQTPINQILAAVLRKIWPTLQCFLACGARLLRPPLSLNPTLFRAPKRLLNTDSSGVLVCASLVGGRQFVL